MGSIHRFNGRRVYLTLGTGALQISRASGGFVVPLAAIEEVHVAESDARGMEIVLTDGESHHGESGGRHRGRQLRGDRRFRHPTRQRPA
ncbi:hypothetical protein ACFQU9_15925 [Actinomadura namibiensis]|uniref:Uncharacterized protein n=1 Tax=Actinomadura namibiensis TaxID=182080 RepID=A0A7W3QN79_ACTNM|nr:hypothetical protein [Actinomadura namibiensis]MBA8953367.1 hypothetical protein [Actinomadura namibiensis]